MTDPLSRRELFSVRALRAIFGCSDARRAPTADSKAKKIERYFRSSLHSYPLLQEMPLEMLVEEAQSRGIPVEGRGKNDIARELFMKTEQTDSRGI